MSVSTHVLDAVTGTPAADLTVRLADVDGVEIGTGSTDRDGRIGAITPSPLPPGRYRLSFDTGAWFADRGRDTFHPEVIVTFDHQGGHSHVPLLLSPFAYSTYRGS